MGRPRDFDESETVEQAMCLFWGKGYQGTSLSDLEESLGIGRKSLYGAFGSKQELFLLALDRYMTRRPPVEAPEAGWQAIFQCFNGGPPYDRRFRSCFVVNTIMESAPLADKEIQARIRRHNRLLREGFTRAARRAMETGHMAEQDAERAALFLCTALQGLSVMARAGTSHKQLHEIADRVLRSVAQK